MALKPCRECGQEVSTQAGTCPKCGSPNPTVSKSTQWIAAALGLAFFGGALLWVNSCIDRTMDAVFQEATPAEAASAARDREKARISVACENAVKAKLRAPSTADFPFGMSMSVAMNDTAATLQSYVDAQNGYGAQIRTNFVCVAEKKSGAWTVEAALSP